MRFELLSRPGAELLEFCAVWREGGAAAMYGEWEKSIKRRGGDDDERKKAAHPPRNKKRRKTRGEEAKTEPERYGNGT